MGDSGVDCNGNVCDPTQVCCAEQGTLSCVTPGTCNGPEISCDGPGDCQAPEVCCHLQGEFSCTDTCGGGSTGLVVCVDQGDCPDNLYCCAMMPNVPKICPQQPCD